MNRNYRSRIALLLAGILITMMIATGCRSGESGEVYVYSYGDYFDPDLIEDFQEETGIHVVLDTYDTAEEMYTVIENGATSYDVICTSDYMIQKMINNMYACLFLEVLYQVRIEIITVAVNVNFPALTASAAGGEHHRDQNTCEQQGDP